MFIKFSLKDLAGNLIKKQLLLYWKMWLPLVTIILFSTDIQITYQINSINGGRLDETDSFTIGCYCSCSKTTYLLKKAYKTIVRNHKYFRELKPLKIDSVSDESLLGPRYLYKKKNIWNKNR